jgi:hypothetical protein
MKFKKILTILLSMSMIASLSACGGKDSSEKEEKDEIITETVAVDEEAEELQKEQEELAEAQQEAQEELAEMEAQREAEDEADRLAQEAVEGFDPENPEETVLELLRGGFETSFGDNMDVTYDESNTTYNISVWQEGFATALETEAGADALNTLSDTLATALQSMTEQIREIDNDANIVFNFLSDQDQETILLTIENGEMTYSITQ